MHVLGLPFLMLTAMGFALAGVLLLYALYTHRSAWVRRIAIVMSGWSLLYLALLLTTSLASREHVLGLHERKAFCGVYLDCHLGVSVEDVAQQATLGGRQADGVFYLITLRVSSDARQAMLAFARPTATIRDGQGRTYRREREAEQAMAAAPFEQRLGPDGAYTTVLVFDLPEDVVAPRLFVSKGNRVERLSELFLIGDENSLFHARTVFALPERG